MQQMVVVEDLQVLVAGCSTLPDAPLASPAVEEATRSFSSASVRHLQAQLKYQSEVWMSTCQNPCQPCQPRACYCMWLLYGIKLLLYEPSSNSNTS